MTRNRIVGLLGSGLLVVGIFSPVFKIPGAKALTFFESGIVDAVGLIGLSILSAIFLFARNYRALLFTGIGALAITANMLAYYHAQLLGTKTAEAVNTGLTQAGAARAQLQWGWGLLVLGSILIMACPLISEERFDEATVSSRSRPVQPVSVARDNAMNPSSGRSEP